MTEVRSFLRFLVPTLSVILLFTTAGLSQGGSQTVNVGYAVITPSSPSGTGFVVFETFVQTRSQDTLEVGVFPPNLTANALLPVDVSSVSSNTLGIAMANPNNALASITLTLRRSDGTLFTTATTTISTRRQVARLITELFPSPPSGGFSGQTVIPAEFSGSLQITSTVPISVVGVKFRGQNYSTIPVTDLAPSNTPIPAMSSGVGGLGAVLFPQFVTGGGWATEIVIVNTTANSLTVRLDVFTPDGTPLNIRLNGQTSSSFTNLTVPGNGVLTLATD
jgi:hypothetical protein